jgi:tetratricopeptide (TPR) repeat protein
MNHNLRIAVGCALASLILCNGFNSPCAAEPAKAEADMRLQYLEWCQSSEMDVASDLVILSCSELIELGKETPRNLAVAFTNRGNGYVFKDDYDRAIADYTAAIRLDPNSVAAYFGRAGAYSDRSDVDRAMADYTAAHRLALNYGSDRTASGPQRDPAIAAVSAHAPVLAATLGSESETTAGGTNAMPKSRPVVQSSLRGNTYPVIDVPDREPVVEPRQPAAADAAGRRSFGRADGAAPSPSVAVGEPGLLLPDSNVRHLTRPELQKLSAEQLQIARNEIFARKGRYFKDERLSSYFAKFAWYQPDTWDVPLNAVEQANVDLIASLEAPAPSTRSATGRPSPSMRARSGAKATGTVQPQQTGQSN